VIQYFLSDNYRTLKYTLNGEEMCTFIFKNALPGIFTGNKIIPITETEIKSIIHSLTSKYSPDYGETTSKFLKHFLSLIWPP
jgi:hypothetical protein